jgi:hypothetical protein
MIERFLMCWLVQINFIFSEPYTEAERLMWRRLWSLLRLDDELIHLLADVLELRCIAGVVFISAAFEGDVPHELIKSVLITVWRIRVFTDSRWLTVGRSSAAMTASSMTGLCLFFAFIRVQPGVSSFYSHGFFELTSDHWFFMTCAAIPMAAAESVQQFLLSDSRVARHQTRLRNLMRAKMMEVCLIPLDLWRVFAKRVIDIPTK